jgi:hypothetical protein
LFQFRGFAAMVSDDTRPLSREHPGVPGIYSLFHYFHTGVFLTMPRELDITANTNLRAADHEALREKALAHGMNVSQYLRFLVSADLSANPMYALQAVEAEHTRLVILAAQQGQKLTPELITNLRDKATVGASAQVQRTLRLLRQAA